MRILIAHIKVWLASKSIISTKKEDVHGRNYQYVYDMFGHREMVAEYLSSNSWLIPKYFGRHY